MAGMSTGVECDDSKLTPPRRHRRPADNARRSAIEGYMRCTYVKHSHCRMPSHSHIAPCLAWPWPRMGHAACR